MGRRRLFPRGRTVRTGGREDRTDVVQGRRHEIIRGELALRFSRQSFRNPSLTLRATHHLNPDVLVHSAATGTPDVRMVTRCSLSRSPTPVAAMISIPRRRFMPPVACQNFWIINAETFKRTLKSNPEKRRCVGRAGRRIGAGGRASVFKRGLLERCVALGLPFRLHPGLSEQFVFRGLHIMCADITFVLHREITFIARHRNVRQR